MGCGVSVFFARALRHGFLNFVLVTQVENDCPVDLLQAQCREVRSNGLRRLALLKLPHDEIERHAARCQIEPTVSALNKFPIHRHTHYQFIPDRQPVLQLPVLRAPPRDRDVEAGAEAATCLGAMTGMTAPRTGSMQDGSKLGCAPTRCQSPLGCRRIVSEEITKEASGL